MSIEIAAGDRLHSLAFAGSYGRVQASHQGGTMENENIPEAKPIEPQPGAQPPQQAASGRAVAALILGVLSLVCMGFFAGIPAIILGSMELRAIKAGAAPAAGESAAKVGYILGIIGTILTCLSILAIIAMIVLGISLGGIEATQNVNFLQV
jgi:hypothetical protein